MGKGGKTIIILGLCLAAFVVVQEVAYYLKHPYRSGPSFPIALLAIAVICLAASALRRRD
jgi:hypothetical protein